MIEFGKIAVIDFDEVDYTKTLDRIMGQIIREAARQWLRTVLISVPARGGFPVLTGAAKSTLAPLGRILRVAVPVKPVARDGRRVIIDRREEGESSQEFEIEDKWPDYTFRWSTDLLHYYINEFYGVIPHAPWGSVEYGERAFLAYTEEALNRRLPNVADYIRFEDG